MRWAVLSVVLVWSLQGQQPTPSRWRNFANDGFLSPGAILPNVVPPVMDHLADEPREFGQGWEAFGNRVGRRVARYQMQNAMFHASAFALRTETRYRPCECSGTWRRVGHAMTRIFITRSEGGHTVPNVPLLGGFAGGALLSTKWYPDRRGAVLRELRLAGWQLSGRSAVNIAREFAPEIRRLLRRK